MFKFFENNVRFRSTHKQTRSFKQSLINQVLETLEIICIQKIYKKKHHAISTKYDAVNIYLFYIYFFSQKIKIKDNFFCKVFPLIFLPYLF